MQNPFDIYKKINNPKTNIQFVDNLSTTELESFNKFIITKALSMNIKNIIPISKVIQYLNRLSPRLYYQVVRSKLCLDGRYHKYIKQSTTDYNIDIIKYISNYYNVGKRDALSYYWIFTQTDISMLTELIELLKDSGLTENEIEKMF